MEMLQSKLNAERRELSEKIEVLTSENTKKERANTTLEN